MVAIKPFKGYRYDVDDLSRVISPPYDVIARDHQKDLVELSPHNFVRLILGDDPDAEECRRDLTRIRRLFQAWIDEGVLRQEDKESIYVYSQVFDVQGEPKRRTGIIPLVELEGFREKHIYPHEKVMSKHVEDRYALLEATEANFGMVFGIYADPAKEVDRLLDEVLHTQPVASGTMDDVLHEVWKIDDDGLIGHLQREMEEKHVFIADGHHRYTTALRYRDAHPERDGARYLMMALVNMYNEGLVILPTHRLIRRDNHDPKMILHRIEDTFHVEPVPRDQMLEKIHGEKFAYGFFCDGDDYVIRLKDQSGTRFDRDPVRRAQATGRNRPARDDPEAPFPHRYGRREYPGKDRVHEDPARGHGQAIRGGICLRLLPERSERGRDCPCCERQRGDAPEVDLLLPEGLQWPGHSTTGIAGR